jgi:uncharacterized membrane protein
MAAIIAIFAIIAAGIYIGTDAKERRVERDANPFVVLGNIKTANGLMVEFYSLKHTKADCVIAVQMFPLEAGRAAVQMDCK